jgi:hypothetical protein
MAQRSNCNGQFVMQERIGGELRSFLKLSRSLDQDSHVFIILS